MVILTSKNKEMQLRGIEISNFKCFDEPIKIDFAPLTILVGPNNAGKSSISQVLKFLSTYDTRLESVQTFNDFLKKQTGSGDILGLKYNFADYSIYLGYNKHYSGSYYDKDKNEVFFQNEYLTLSCIKVLNKDGNVFIRGSGYSEPNDWLQDNEDDDTRFHMDDCFSYDIIVDWEFYFGKKSILEEIEEVSNRVDEFSGYLINYFHSEVTSGDEDGFEKREIYDAHRLLIQVQEDVLRFYKELDANLEEDAVEQFKDWLNKLFDFPLYVKKSISKNHDYRFPFEKSYSKIGHSHFLEIDNKKLEKLLKPFGIAPKKVGIKRDDFSFTLNGNNLMECGKGVFNLASLAIYFQLNPANLVTEDGYTEIQFIEEPEIHLHPDWQSKLGDFFVEIIKAEQLNIVDGKPITLSDLQEEGIYGAKASPCILIETHSEYLIRRLQYLVATGKANAEDVVIYYIADNEDDGEKVRKITLNEKGQLSQDFGTGFLDESHKLYRDLLRATLKPE